VALSSMQRSSVFRSDCVQTHHSAGVSCYGPDRIQPDSGGEYLDASAAEKMASDFGYARELFACASRLNQAEHQHISIPHTTRAWRRASDDLLLEPGRDLLNLRSASPGKQCHVIDCTMSCRICLCTVWHVAHSEDG
jgi:hypothetical protein